MIQKLFLLLLVGVAAVVMVPQLRARVWPKVQPALNPLYEWSAKNRVNEIRELVKRADAQGHTVPPGNGFAHFVDSEDLTENASQDPWGNPYYIVFSGTTFQIGSAGKDREAGTADDILSNPDAVTHAPERRF
ncbi:type II secretion system protein GspG [Longimicrobium sp.]|uniref:type II secretion system protein GspG n=1 Tax=Longimicrobium sp. TaxID=2029185 RepID=UPI002CE27C6E|nr:type II secretion system protein GspG [Longimicrobium sp.]HSU15708.1 type II secretion system protein GspG [Longimicrobium sp.]